MARKRKENDPCTGCVVRLCDDNWITVMEIKSQIEKNHQTSMSEVINRIISEWRALSK